ncbi:MAG TPA: energy transducer TonB [Bacteroidia bacterium]|jgi:TonB family protein|nr:energy transducer TonB [Bacteroidia bacterium]
MKKYFLLLLFLFSADFIFAQSHPKYPPPPPKTNDGQNPPPVYDTITTVMNQQGEDDGPPDVTVYNGPDTNQVYSYAEVMPSSSYDFNQYLQQNIKYPADARDAGKTGTVYLSFIVERDGSITNVQVKKSAGYPSLDNEAKKVITAMPKWNPGQMNGKNVRVEVVQPVKFVLPPPPSNNGK